MAPVPLQPFTVTTVANNLSAPSSSPIPFEGPEVLIRGEMIALIDEGDRLAEYGFKERVIDAYTRALIAGRRYVQVRPDDTAARLRLGGACVRVGGLQSQLASAAEARHSLELGRRVLAPMKTKGEGLKERNRLLEQIESGLRRLAMD